MWTLNLMSGVFLHQTQILPVVDKKKIIVKRNLYA